MGTSSLISERIWISCAKFTVAVTVVNGRITEAAPIVQKFKGQPLDSLVRGAAGRFGPTIVTPLPSTFSPTQSPSEGSSTPLRTVDRP
jgi:hypothetical protein